MQTAIYNKQTMPLNTKFISKGSVETNYWQIIISIVVLFVPVVIIVALLALFERNTAYLIMMAIGIAFMLTNSLWIRNIYNRLMKRRYENMESFRATR
jgi:membrane protein YdbS with pleckstrin-like domain